MSAPVYDIAMLGPSGVGKTSLLSAIHTEFLTMIPGTELRVRSVIGSASYLQDRRAELERICRSAYVEEPGIRGTAAAKSIELALGRIGAAAHDDGHLVMRFSDHPGSWMFSDPGAPTKSRQALQARFDQAHVLIVVVDTPALMASQGIYNQAVNRPQQAAERVHDWLARDERRLVVFSPVKCEAWIDRASPDAGLDRVGSAMEVEYKEAFKFVRDKGVPAVLIPVRTVGGLIHDGFRMGSDGSLRSRFRGAVALPKYEPAWGGEVLRRVLIESIKRRQHERNLFEEIATWFGHHRDIREAVVTMRGQSYGPSRELGG